MAQPSQPAGHLEKVRALAATARQLFIGGTRAASEVPGAPGPSVITVYDHVAEKPEYTIAVPSHVHALAVAGEVLVAGCADGFVRSYAVKTGARSPDPKGKLLREFQAHTAGACHAVAVLAKGAEIATAGADGALRVFALDGTKKKEWQLASRPLSAVAVDMEGALAAGGDDGLVRVVREGDPVRSMAGHEGAVTCLAFTPADGRLVSGGDDGTVRIWYLAGGENDAGSEVRSKDDSLHIGGTTALLFTPAKNPDDYGERLVSAGADGKLRVWRMSERRKPRTLDAGSEASSSSRALAFVPSTRPGTLGTLLAGGDARTLFGHGFDAEGQPTDVATRVAHGFDVFAEALKGRSLEVREKTAVALAALGEPEARALLLGALEKDTEPAVRARIATELAAKGRSDAKKAIRARLDDEAPAVRTAALSALRVLEADVPLAPLRSALESRFADTRRAGLELLPPLFATSPLVAGLIASRLADEDALVRRSALVQLIAIQTQTPAQGGAVGAAPFRAGFERGRADVRADALVRGALAGLLSGPNANDFAPIVGKALDDEDADVRRIAFVLTVLGRPALAAWLEGTDEAFARALVDVLQRAGELSGAPSETAVAEQRARLLPAAATPASLTEADREPLGAALACRTPDTCLRGARGLALLGDMRALGALLTISREPDVALRREAAFALVALSDPRAKKRIAWMLNDADAAVRFAALTCYRRVEKEPLLVAEAALHSSSEDLRVRGLDILVKEGRGKPAAETLLGDAIEDEAPKVRGEAFRTLWAWHEADPLGPIDRALSARFPDLRLRAVQELAAFASGREKSGEAIAAPSLERLVKAIADRDHDVANAAYDATLEIKAASEKRDTETALAGIASTHATLRAKAAKDAAKGSVEKLRSALSRLLEDTESAVRIAAIESLDALLPAEHGALAVGLQSSHLDLRVRAAELLARRLQESLVDPMQALLADKELLQRMPPGVIVPLRQRAAMALANLGTPRLSKYFATVLVKDDDPMVREQAARGLSNASRRGEEGHLLDLLGHEELPVRSWAAEGLARLGDARALPVLTGTLRHEHPPIRVGAILSFAALGPEGYSGMLQGLEDPSRHVQRIVLSVILARDLRAFRRNETPDLLTSALSSQRPEVRFTAARALELRIVAEQYAAHLVEVLMPDRPEKAADMEKWPSEEVRVHLMMGLAEALAGDRPEQRYAAAQALRLRDRPVDYFREVQRAVAPRSVKTPWVPETHPIVPAPDPAAQKKGPLALLRRLFAGGDEKAVPGRADSQVPADEQNRLRQLAFGAYIGLLRQASSDDEAHRVRRDAIDRIVGLYDEKAVSLSSATPALARALDDPNHLVRQAAFAALRRVHTDDRDTPLALALASSSADVVKAALDEWAARGESAKPRIVAALDSRVPAARKYAFELLEKLSPKGSLEPLLAALSSEHADIRIGVLERLSTSQDTRVAAALVKALESDHDDLRLRAAELLAARKDDRVVEALAPWLRAEGPAVAQRARDALVRLGSPAAVRALMARIEDSAPEDERRVLADTVGKTRAGEAAISALAKLFTDEAESVRRTAFHGALAIVGPRDDAPRERGAPKAKPRVVALAKRFLEAAVRSPFADVRALAARELDELADSDADAWLTGLFTDRDRGVRTLAVSAYARRVETKNAPAAPLEDVLRGGARETMLAAAEGLAHARIAAALRPLLLFARAGEGGERERALLALGTLGDGRALEELETVASGGTEEAPAEPSMQAAALEALGRLAGPASRLEADARDRIRDAVESSIGEKRQEMSVAAVKALRWLGGERSRARIEATLTERSSSTPERVAAAKALGELADAHAEAALARALDDGDDDVRDSAREALEKLFPADRLRVEFIAVESEHADISDPAAAYLADEGDAGRLLEKLAKLSNESLRMRIRFGLARRAQVPADALIKLLGDASPAARADAGWLAGVRSNAQAKGALGAALVAAAVRAAQLYAEAARTGKEPERQAEQEAWARCLWAARAVDPQAVQPHARTWLLESALPIEIRTAAALALRGGGADDTASLVKALSDREVAVRRAAAAALAPAKDVLAIAVSPLDPVRLGRAAREAPLRNDALSTATGRRILLPAALPSGNIAGLRELADRAGKDGKDAKDATEQPLHAIEALGRVAGAARAEAIETLQRLAFKGGTEPVRKAAFRSLRRAMRLAAKEEASR